MMPTHSLPHRPFQYANTVLLPRIAHMLTSTLPLSSVHPHLPNRAQLKSQVRSCVVVLQDARLQSGLLP